MNTIETGGPAFPMQEPQAIHDYAVAAVDGLTDPDERDRAYLKARAEAVGGASMRDYFAAMALQGAMAGGSIRSGTTNAEIATVAYGLADAMLAARKEKP